MVCAWCNNEIVTAFEDACSDTTISHGMCDNCYNKKMWPNRPELVELLDKLDAPVLVIDPSGNVSTANKMAQTLLQKDLSDIVGLQGGVVFECVFAKLPEGCGNTIHCDGCTIRKTVMDTFLTGNSHFKVSAGLIHGTSDNHFELKCIISTEKVNDVVLLRIEKIGD